MIVLRLILKVYVKYEKFTDLKSFIIYLHGINAFIVVNSDKFREALKA